MSILTKRLDRLERLIGSGKGRLIIVSASSGNSDEVIDAMLLENGIRRTKTDQVIVFMNLYEDRNGAVIVCNDPPRLLNVIPQV